jgi:SAM-dependent methyltransferase
MSIEPSFTSTRSGPALAVRLLPLGFAATTFLSALLLFGVQPMFAKMVLPTLGGSPAVWSVAMVFFQALLLGGYLYAHLSTRWLSGRQALALHALLVAAAFLFLPLAPPQAAGAPEDGQSLWLLGLFAGTVGPPFFVLAATAPLLQAWFARSGHAEAGNPYQLYVASNLGSFCALLAYPLLIEPLTPLGAQAQAWMALFAILGLGLAACGLAAIGHDATASGRRSDEATAPTWGLRVAWVGLAAVPSGLLVTVTAHLSTDVASAPLLWVLPLAVFLLTFILAFRDNAVIPDPILAKGMAWFTPFAVLSLVGYVLPLTLQIAIHVGLFFLAAMVCHRRLYGLRPAAAGLTSFYLWMSFGGMIGGLFAGLAAPLLFDTIIEHRLLVVAALLCMPAAAGALPWRRQAAFAAFAVAISALYLFAVALPGLLDPVLMRAATLAVGLSFLWIVLLNRWGPLATAGAAAAAFISLNAVAGRPEAVARSFFGVNYVRVTSDGSMRQLQHGSTIHGGHRLRGLDGQPYRGRPLPMAYYHDAGGINVALTAARVYRRGEPGEIGVIGLGAGGLACQSGPNESWTFFEIDRRVVEFAKRADLFPFLSTCTPEARIVVGDGRLTIRQERKRFDVIILDAFSSDAVPAHLLTREAFAVYAERLKPGGVIIAHVSNRYMDLIGVVESAAVANGLAALSVRMKVDPDDPRQALQQAAPTSVVAMSRDSAYVDLLATDRRWRRADPASERLGWTDDYANIMGAMLRKLLSGQE